MTDDDPVVDSHPGEDRAADFEVVRTAPAVPADRQRDRLDAPRGLAAITVHRGSFADLGAAHAAVVNWCTARGHRLTGTRWEVYGPHDHPAQQWTEISWILAQAER